MTAHRPIALGTRHAIAAGHPLAAQAGYDILQQGGNAIDAGVAAGMVLGVVHSDLVGFAGVAPIMIRRAGQREVISIDGLGVWPQAVDVEVFRRDHGGTIPQGLLRTVVPAAPAAWIHALQHYGSWHFEDVARAAMEHARDGFGVFDLFSAYVSEHEADYRRHASNAAIYLARGRAPRVGERLVQTDLARTIGYMMDEAARARRLGRVAGLNAARDAFYRGDIARTICEHHVTHGGWLRRHDLEGYRVREEPTLAVPFAGRTLYACGPWCQGISLAQAAAMLERMPIAELEHNSIGYIHQITEALKLVFADREQHVGDPAFVDVPVTAMLADDYLAARIALIDATTAWPGLPPGGDPLAGEAIAPSPPWLPASLRESSALEAIAASAGDTSYVAVMDADGNVFSATPSDTSKDTEVIPGTGLAVSSRGSQGRVEADHPACVAPGKRPRLTPNPAMVMDGDQPFMAFGTPGGDVQIQAMLQVLLNVTQHGMDIQSAVEAPRFASYSFPSWFSPYAYHPGLLAMESRIDESVRTGLGERGHRIQDWPEYIWKAGAVCAVMHDRDEGLFHGGADPRRAGYALAG